MKKIISFATYAIIVSATTATVAAAEFEGFSAGVSINSTKNKTTEGFWYNDIANEAQTSGSARKTKAKISAGFGIAISGPYIATAGFDYLPEKSTVESTYTTDPAGKLLVPIRSRMDFYIAPGIKLDSDKLLYVKAGLSALHYNTVTDETFAAQNGTPGKTGLFVGIGYKQYLQSKSPFHFSFDYTYGNSKNGKIDDGTKYFNTKVTYSSFSTGLGYSF